ncbi:MAG TPA: DUF6282 family protein [Anaerolineae bacterium]|nr:DUF6282 family protein [Anaerolineae bacterium]
MHVHSAPDVVPRILDDLELARQAQAAGMRAICIKNHFESTASRATLAGDETGFPVYGGIALNHTVGGLNPHAVEFALRMGARVVWLPTLHAARFLQHRDHVRSMQALPGEGKPGISLLDAGGQLDPAVPAILDLVAAHDAVLATGHVGIDEARAVVREAARRGVRRIVVTHPLASFVGYTAAQAAEMLDLGATWIEHVYNDTTRIVSHPISVAALAEGIKAVGAAHCIMSTDSGQALSPVPVQQMAIYIQDMLALGLTEAEVRTMVADNPARALGL